MLLPTHANRPEYGRWVSIYYWDHFLLHKKLYIRQNWSQGRIVQSETRQRAQWNLRILMIRMKSGKLEIWIQTYYPHPAALITGETEAKLWFSKRRFRKKSEKSSRGVQWPDRIDYSSSYFEHLRMVQNMALTLFILTADSKIYCLKTHKPIKIEVKEGNMQEEKDWT